MKNEPVVTRVKERLKTDRKFRLTIICVCTVVLILILFFNIYGKTVTTESSALNDDVTFYIGQLEDKLETLLSKVNGAGKVKVCITVESGRETVLAYTTTSTESDTKKETVTTPVIVNGKTVVLKELYPKIKGVLIVAEGADSLTVYTKLQQATLSLLDVEVGRIEILTMK